MGGAVAGRIVAGRRGTLGLVIGVGLTSDVVKGSMGALPLPLPITVILGVIAIVRVTMKTLGYQ